MRTGVELSTTSPAFSPQAAAPVKYGLAQLSVSDQDYKVWVAENCEGQVRR